MKKEIKETNQKELSERRALAVKAINLEIKTIKLQVVVKGFKYRLMKDYALEKIILKYCKKYKVDVKDVKKIGKFEIVN